MYEKVPVDKDNFIAHVMLPNSKAIIEVKLRHPTWMACQDALMQLFKLNDVRHFKSMLISEFSDGVVGRQVFSYPRTDNIIPIVSSIPSPRKTWRVILWADDKAEQPIINNAVMATGYEQAALIWCKQNGIERINDAQHVIIYEALEDGTFSRTAEFGSSRFRDNRARLVTPASKLPVVVAEPRTVLTEAFVFRQPYEVVKHYVESSK